MAGVTDRPFRQICKDLGAGMVYTEFVSSNGIIRENLKTLDMIKFLESERPIGVQIFGEDPDIVGKSAHMIYDKVQPDLIDINFGCPVPKVTKKGAGSGALKNLSQMQEITSSVIENVPNIPVTVKMRSGWNTSCPVSNEAGLILEKCGVKAITLHPRSTNQKFSGQANWELIKELKETVSIPIIGNGDINNIDDYIKIKEVTNCDGFMIGRASLGNPWIFKQINNYIINKPFDKEPTIIDKINLCIMHFKLIKEDRAENLCVNLSKKHFSWYLKGFNGANFWRKKIMLARSSSEISDILNEIKNDIS